MKNHKFSRQILEKLDTLSETNNYRAFLGILIDYLFIGASVYMVSISWYFYPLAVLLIGTRQRAFVTLLHDAGHGVLFKNTRLNDFVGKYCTGYLIFLGFDDYINSHVVHHHNYIGNDEKDPDLKFYNYFGLYEDLDKKAFIRKHLLKPMLFGNVLIYAKALFNDRVGYVKEGSKEAIIMMTYWTVIIGVFAWQGWLFYLILLWFVPFFIIFPWQGWFIGISEHFLLIKNPNEIDKSWNRFSHPLEAFFSSIHNENYHLTHHLRPDIPYWNLKKAHQIMMDDEKYKDLNIDMGGIFLSSNKNPTFWNRIHKFLDDRELERTSLN